MHEFSEVLAMIRQARAQLAAGARIRRLTIVVGEASGHDPAHIAAHFAEAARGNPELEGASLEFVAEKLAARCAGCGAEFDAAKSLLVCSHCGGTQLRITAGDQVRLAEMVSEAEPVPHPAR